MWRWIEVEANGEGERAKNRKRAKKKKGTGFPEGSDPAQSSHGFGHSHKPSRAPTTSHSLSRLLLTEPPLAFLCVVTLSSILIVSTPLTQNYLLLI